MDDVQNRFARELADAIAAAVAQSADVEACHDRAREAGFELKVTLDATVGFAPLSARLGSEGAIDADEAEVPHGEPQPFEVSRDDRRFLRSLRIAADELRVEEAT